MTKRVLLILTTLALAVASAKTYRLTLFQPASLSGTELKAGEYKLDLNGEKVTLTDGRSRAEANVKVENANEKFSTTTVRFSNGDGKYRIQEIRVGGTNMKLVVH